MSEARRQSRTPSLSVVALGGRTAVGLRAYPAAAAVRAGISRVREHPFMIDKSGQPFIVAMDRTLKEIGAVERMYALAASVLDEVLAQLPLGKGVRIPVFLGLPEPRPQFTERLAKNLCERLKSRLAPRFDVRIHPVMDGGAAGVVALERAAAQIHNDPGTICLVGGVDSFIDADILEALDAAARIASTSSRWGFPPGEGAGVLAVCGAALARQCGWKVLASIASVAVSEEPNRVGTKTICVGVGMAAAFRKALTGTGGPVGTQFCDINGERYREHEFSYAILRVPPSAYVDAVDYVSPVRNWGHTGAATAPLLMLLPIVYHQRRASPGAWPMVWCGSDNGRRGAVILHLDERNS